MGQAAQLCVNREDRGIRRATAVCDGLLDGNGTMMVLRGRLNALWGMLPTVLSVGGPVDRVELKALLDGEFESALAVLGPEVDPPRVRRVHYFDTPDLALLRRGVVVRARVTGRPGSRPCEEVVVKLRRPAPHGPYRTWSLAMELDALPTEVAWAASLRRRLPEGHVPDAVDRRWPARHLLGKKQRTLLRSVVGDEVDLEDLVVMGPVDAVRLTSGRPGDRIGIESWTLPDSSRLLELSAKCRPGHSREVAAQVRALIADHGIVLSDRQATKTQLLLHRIAGIPGRFGRA
jgi:hypothetical protein